MLVDAAVAAGETQNRRRRHSGNGQPINTSHDHGAGPAGVIRCSPAGARLAELPNGGWNAPSLRGGMHDLTITGVGRWHWCRFTPGGTVVANVTVTSEFVGSFHGVAAGDDFTH